MFAFGFGAPTPNARREEIPFGAGGNPHRFFQKKKASDGDCAIRSFNNTVGSERITKPMVIEEFEEEQTFFERSSQLCAIPGSKTKLLSTTLLERLARRVGYTLSKVRVGRSPRQKFDWILQQSKGRFLLVTMTDSQIQARDGHDLNARNHRHWVAVSADENLVVDSLARRVGPQTISPESLKRSVRDGIIQIYVEIHEARKKSQ